MLDGHEEARLAFLGATRTLPSRPAARSRSSTWAAARRRSRSARPAAAWRGRARCPWVGLAVGPPPRRGPGDGRGARGHARRGRGGRRGPEPRAGRDLALAVGGSAASLRRLVGPMLGPEATANALAALQSGTAATVAAAWDIDRSACGCFRGHTGARRRLATARQAAAARLRRTARRGPRLADGRLNLMAKQKDIDTTPWEPYARAGARIVRVRTRELFSHAASVLDTEDIERVHDMRAASRRLRAVLEIFAARFPKAEYRSVLRDVRRLADALGERRDPDVHIAAMRAFAADLAASQPSGHRG